MDHVNAMGISVIQVLQDVFKNHSELMIFLSRLGDPKAAFLVYYPLAHMVNPLIGIKVVWVAAISELLNTVFKWVLFGPRPYWWIKEGGFYGNDPVDLQQFRITCETGPGSPSGHCMVTSAVMYILVAALLRYIHNRTLFKTCWTVFIWIIFMTFMAAISVSRCFIATHFPHQVITGTIAGVVLGKVCDNMLPAQPSTKEHFLGAASVLILGISIFSVVKLFGIDPFWSVSLAKKYCQDPSWIHLDTTLFFALIKDMASLIGLGLALCFNEEKTHLSLPVTVLAMGAALSFTQASQLVKLPSHIEIIYYLLGAIKHIMVIYSVVLIRAIFGCYLGHSSIKDSTY